MPVAERAVGSRGDSVYRVRAVTRALSVLKAFTPDRPQLTLTEVVKATDLDKGTARRLLVTLEGEGFVSFDSFSQRYRLGPAIPLLSRAIVREKDIRVALRPILQELGDDTRATVHLSRLAEDWAICIERYQPPAATVMFPHWPVGGRTNLNTGAAPRILLASMADDDIMDLLKRPSRRRELAAPVKEREIWEHIAGIRSRGWIVSVDEVSEGLTALGVPLRSGTGEFVGALSIVGLTAQMMRDGQPVHLDRIMKVTEIAARILGEGPADASE